MDHVVSMAFDEMLKRFEDLDARSADRWERLERRIDETKVTL
jgi:hypothetical protein